MAIGQARQEDTWSTSDDVRLVAAVTGGRTDAFAELYRRYAQRALSVARRVVDNEEDAQDAVAEAFAKVLHVLRANSGSPRIDFGPYLLVATRHAAVDIVRRKARAWPTDYTDQKESATGFDEPGERAVAHDEGRLITQALTALSERERLMLWLVEVQDVSLRDAAKVLGLKPNHAAQIAMRARRRLRRGYMRAHLGNGASSTCRFTLEHLPAYVDRQLPQHSLEKVDEHMGACLTCQQRLDQLSDLRPRLRRALLFPLSLRLRASEWWKRRGTPVRYREVTDSLSTVSAGALPDVGVTAPGDLLQGAAVLATVAGDITQAVGAAGPAVHRLVAAASATLLVLGFPGPGASDAGLHPNARPPSQEQSGPGLVFDGASGPPVVQPPSPRTGSSTSTEGTASLSLSPDPDPVDSVGGGATGLEQASEIPAEAHLPAVAAVPLPDPGVGGTRGLERASETRAEGHLPSVAARAEPGAAGPVPDTAVGGVRALERASETLAEGHLSSVAARAEPGAAGPVPDPGGGTRGLERASETPAEGHLPAVAAGPLPDPGVGGARGLGGPPKS